MEESNLWGSSPPPRFSGPVADHSAALSKRSWRRRESNPHFSDANAASFRWTTSPVWAAGIEPAWTWFRARWPAIDPHPVVASCGVTGGDRTRTSSFTARRALQYTTATTCAPRAGIEPASPASKAGSRPSIGENADATNEGAQLEVPPSGSRHEAARSRIERINELRRLVASVGVEGIEPPSAVCRTAALPLDETPIVASVRYLGLMLVAAWA